MKLDLSDKLFLTPLELSWLVTGVRAKIHEDRYAEIIIQASRGVISQIKILLRWGEYITLVEV